MKAKSKLILAGILTCMFIILIVLIRCVDVAPIGPEGSSIGLSGLNKKGMETFTYIETWYKITNYLGYLALAVAAGFAVLGLVQLIQRKSLLKVDANILGLGILFIVTIGLYVFFNKVAVDYRPVILPDEGALEAAFPSSHTVLTIVVMGGTMLQLPYYVKNAGVRRVLQVVLTLILLVTVVGRLLSGAHWLTDILAGVIISLAFLFAYSGVLSSFTEKHAVV